jgi:hypothetical protein
MTTAQQAGRTAPTAEPAHVDGADLLGAISGPPSAFAEASLEAEAWRIRAAASP